MLLYFLEIQLVVCDLKIEGMDSDDEQGYKPPPEFQLEAKEPLIDLSSTDSTELWLIRLPPRKPVSFILWHMRAQFLGRKTKKKKKQKQHGAWLLKNFNCHVNFFFILKNKFFKPRIGWMGHYQFVLQNCLMC
jgi:hypothetical protein